MKTIINNSKYCRDMFHDQEKWKTVKDKQEHNDTMIQKCDIVSSKSLQAETCFNVEKKVIFNG